MFCVIVFTQILPILMKVDGVYGPFNSKEEVETWTKRAVELFRGRVLVISPMESPASLNLIDPKIN